MPGGYVTKAMTDDFTRTNSGSLWPDWISTGTVAVTTTAEWPTTTVVYAPDYLFDDASNITVTWLPSTDKPRASRRLRARRPRPVPVDDAPRRRAIDLSGRLTQ